MLNRGSPGSPGSASFAIDSATQALQRTNLDDMQRPLAHQPNPFPSPSAHRGRASAPVPPTKRNKPGFKLSDINPDASIGAANVGLDAGRPSLADAGRRAPNTFDTPFANFNRIVYVSAFLFHPILLFFNLPISDPSGRLVFTGKAVLHASGVDFSNGSSYAINMEQLVLQNELGRGNYGTVKRVLHKPTNVTMAMKVRGVLESFHSTYVIHITNLHPVSVCTNFRKSV